MKKEEIKAAVKPIIDFVIWKSEYDTEKIVHIKDKCLGIFHRVIQGLILGYIIGYVIVWQKGYQEYDSVVSVTSTKVKGVSFTNLSESKNPGRGEIVWDVADYVIPPQENDAFFVMTNAIVTYNQTQGKCPEDETKPDALCNSDADCEYLKPVVNGNGVRTGKCVKSPLNANIRVCEIYAWCPVEDDFSFPIPGKPLIQNADTFTVLLKNQIEFPNFNVKRRNILDNMNRSYLESCRYNASDEHDRFCPIFELGYILQQAEVDITNISMFGGFILVKIDWDCDLDKSIDSCVPEYSFRRLDDPAAKIAKGKNFRFADYYYEAGIRYRDLIKAFGIRFVIKVTGEAGRCSCVQIILKLGSGMALMAIASAVCDGIILCGKVLSACFCNCCDCCNCFKSCEYYKDKKYLIVDDTPSSSCMGAINRLCCYRGPPQSSSCMGAINRLCCYRGPPQDSNDDSVINQHIVELVQITVEDDAPRVEIPVEDV